MHNTPWHIKHRPLRFSELLFTTDAHIRTLQWLKGRSKGALHISGAPGIGKTALVHAVARALRHRVTNVEAKDFASLPELALGAQHGLDGSRNILLIDEDCMASIPICAALALVHRCAKQLPVVITSTDLRLRDIPTIPIARMHLDSIQQALERIYAKESGAARIPRPALYKLAEYRNYDLRSVINYAQLYSKGEFDLRHLERLRHCGGSSIFVNCAKILAKRMVPAELEEIYDSKMVDICLNSMYADCQNFRFLADAVIQASSAACLPSDYEFLMLERINCYKGSFSYQKGGLSTISVNWNTVGECAATAGSPHFLSLVNRNKISGIRLPHFQAILSSLDKSKLSKDDSDILNRSCLFEEDTRQCRYVYHAGYSDAVKRDVSIQEILES